MVIITLTTIAVLFFYMIKAILKEELVENKGTLFIKFRNSDAVNYIGESTVWIVKENSYRYFLTSEDNDKIKIYKYVIDMVGFLKNKTVYKGDNNGEFREKRTNR